MTPTPPQTNQQVIIDLAKSPDIADAMADAQPGDEVCLRGVIKSKDDQTLVVTVQEVDPNDGDDTDKKEADAETPDDGTDDSGNEGSGDVQAPAGGMLGETAGE